MRVTFYLISISAILLIKPLVKNSSKASTSVDLYDSFQEPIVLKASESAEGISFTYVTAGDNFTCGLSKEGDVYCWGDGAEGHLGNGSTQDHLEPIKVSGDLTFTSIDAGWLNTCGITTGGQAYCWGQGRYGRLGNGSTKNQLKPVAVAGDLRFQSISAGYLHTCAITTDNKAYCWGMGQNGQLGNGASKTHLGPVPVYGGISFASISVGAAHTCGISTEGRAYCWGRGDFENYLGRAKADRSKSKMVPVEVSGDFNYTTISVGNDHTCALSEKGKINCWGRNRFGNLGTGTRDKQKTPVEVSGNYTFSSVSSGDFESCGLTQNGQVYCWGRNSSGQVGDNTTKMRAKPVLVAGQNDRTFTNISVGNQHVCATTTGGDIYCWGQGSSGQLGNGSTVEKQLTPVKVVSQTNQ